MDKAFEPKTVEARWRQSWEDSGAFAALDARSGTPLWHFQANQDWKASPMTYMVDGEQYIAFTVRASPPKLVAVKLPNAGGLRPFP